MVAHCSIKMLVCFGNWGAGSLEAALLNLRISSHVSQGDRPEEPPAMGGVGKFLMLTVCHCISNGGFYPLSLSCSVGGITRAHCCKCSWGEPHTRLLILHEVTLNKDTNSPGYSVTSKSITLLHWAALVLVSQKKKKTLQSRQKKQKNNNKPETNKQTLTHQFEFNQRH